MLQTTSAFFSFSIATAPSGVRTRVPSARHPPPPRAQESSGARRKSNAAVQQIIHLISECFDLKTQRVCMTIPGRFNGLMKCGDDATEHCRSDNEAHSYNRGACYPTEVLGHCGISAHNFLLLVNIWGQSVNQSRHDERRNQHEGHAHEATDE